MGYHGTPLSVPSELTELFCNNTAGHIVIASSYYTHRANRGEVLASKTPYWLGYNYYSSDLRYPRGPRPRQFRVVVGGDNKRRPGSCRNELRRRDSARQSLRDTRGKAHACRSAGFHRMCVGTKFHVIASCGTTLSKILDQPLHKSGNSDLTAPATSGAKAARARSSTCARGGVTAAENAMCVSASLGTDFQD